MDMKESINNIIVEILGKGIKVSDLTPEKSLVKDFGADSKQLLEIALTIATDFDIGVPKEEVADLNSVQDIYDFVARHKDIEL